MVGRYWYMVNSALVNSNLIYFLLVDPDLITGQFKPRENMVRSEPTQGLSAVKVRIDQSLNLN